MQVSETTLDGVKLITPHTNHEDFRGTYVELYNRERFKQHGIDIDFVEDDISTSTHHVLRGVHGDGKTSKLVSCLVGRFYLLVVNNDPAHPQFRKWQGFTLSESNRLQVLIPPKFGNGHVVMSDRAIFHYKQSSSYDRPSQFTLLWNDPLFKFWWPVSDPIISRRDLGLE
jgi:dTDP-4-dehydrorhamnose 3,5-epimerase